MLPAAIRNHPYRSATIFALATAAISGTNNFLAKIAVTAVKDPIVFTTLKNAIVALVLVGIIIGLKRWKEVAGLTKGQIVRLCIIGVVGGAVPFALFFTGLAQTSAISASLIHKTLFVWVAVLALPFLRERFSFNQWVGVAALFVANLGIGGFSGFSFNAGEFMILCATLLWAVENIVAKIVLKDVSVAVVAAARMTIGSFLLLALIAWQGNISMASGLSATQWGWTLLTSLLLSGYVLCWYSALKRAPATYVAALLVPATLVTNALSAVFITHALSGAQIANMLLFMMGAGLLVVFAKKTGEVSSQHPSPQVLVKM